MSSLVNLPPELSLLIVRQLPASDLCSLRSSCSSLRDICDMEAVWLRRCQQDFNVEISPDTSARHIYQNLLYKFGHLLGTWQRLNLTFYGGLLRVYYEAGAIKFEHLMPTSDIYQELSRLQFLTMTDTSVENHDLLTCREKAVVRQEDEGELVVAVPSLTEYITSPAEWRDLLDTFRAWDTTRSTESAVMKFVSVYHNRNLFLYSRVLTEDWRNIHHGQHSSGCPLLSSLTPGVFKGDYGGHGIELVHFRDGQAVKVTGDPNVPFNQVTFRVTGPQCLDLSLETQRSLAEVREATESGLHLHTSHSGLRLKFLVPEQMVQRLPVTWSDCLGRWAAQAQIASHMFQDSQFILANLVLFSQDEFAVMFLDLNTIAMFHRVKELELKN